MLLEKQKGGGTPLRISKVSMYLRYIGHNSKLFFQQVE
jgi:hypothetical protein